MTMQQARMHVTMADLMQVLLICKCCHPFSAIASISVSQSNLQGGLTHTCTAVDVKKIQRTCSGSPHLHESQMENVCRYYCNFLISSVLNWNLIIAEQCGFSLFILDPLLETVCHPMFTDFSNIFCNIWKILKREQLQSLA